MRKRKFGTCWICLGIVIVAVFGILAGCDGNGMNGPLPELLPDVLSVDFGIVEAEKGTKNLSVTVTNSGEESATVSAAVLSDTTNYTL